MTHNIAPELVEQAVAIGDVLPWPGNARRGDMDKLKMSLTLNTQYRELVVQKSTGQIMAGNQTHRAAVELGWDMIAVAYRDVSDEEALAIVLMDNKAADDNTYDDTELYELLLLAGDMGINLEATGFDDADVAILAQVTGALGVDAADFLADIDIDEIVVLDDNAQMPDTGRVSLAFSLTEDEKAKVVRKLRDVQEGYGLDNMTDALVALADV
jgi:ParB-like chromosome segregation protein Spo0J